LCTRRTHTHTHTHTRTRTHTQYERSSVSDRHDMNDVMHSRRELVAPFLPLATSDRQ